MHSTELLFSLSYRYDYPLLQAELFNTGLQNLIGEFYVIDSLPALKYIFDQEVQDDKIEEQLFENDNFVTGNKIFHFTKAQVLYIFSCRRSCCSSRKVFFREASLRDFCCFQRNDSEFL